ncbi:ribonuclease Z [Pseudomonas entomophila]|uniref:ribonuclease Z n=1 Tax=Pseudomonas entomophila TaxID=312306 RepID=UPI003EB858D4
MDLLFLGTCAGLPTRARNVSATAVIASSGSDWYLVDCGEATQHQLLRTPLSLRDLQAIFISHVHGDHCFGLPGLLASAGTTGRTAPLDLVMPRALHEWVRLSLAVSASRLSFELRLRAVEDFEPWHHRTVRVDTIGLSHRVPSHGFVFTETDPHPRLDIEQLMADGIPRGPLWGEIARGRGVEHAGAWVAPGAYLRAAWPAQRVIVCGDNDTPELLAEVAVGADVLVHEATFTEPVIARTQETYGHSTAAAVARFAERVGVPNLVLTHFSARYQGDARRSPSIEDVRAEAQRQYAGQLVLARDLQRYRLNREKVLVPVFQEGR